MDKKFLLLPISILFIFIFFIFTAGCIAPTGLSVYITSVEGSPSDIDTAFSDHDNSPSTDPVINPILNLTATIYAAANTSTASSSLISGASASPWTLTSYTVTYTVVSSNVQVPAGFSVNSYTSGTSIRLTSGTSQEVSFRPMDHVTHDWFVNTVYPTYGSMSLKAVVTFYGKTDSGLDVSVSGEFDINATDFAYSSS